MNSILSEDIQREFNRLIKLIAPIENRSLKRIDGTGGKVSVAELIAYQIGWGKCLIRWYEEGVKGQIAEMPGEGFSKWDYTAIAAHFYKKYLYDSAEQQVKIFHQVVDRILEIVKTEFQTGNLDRMGVWPWCRLASGKEWPLSKWIRVNTVSPYKRAAQLINQTF